MHRSWLALSVAFLAALCAVLPASASAAARPQVSLRLALPVIFENDMPTLDGIVSDRRGLRSVRIVWGQGSTSVWRSSMNAERVTRMPVMDAVAADIHYMTAGTYTIRVTATNLAGRTTTKMVKVSVERYSVERERQLCVQYDCGPVDTDPEVGPDGF